MAVPSLMRRDSPGPSRLLMPCSHADALLDARSLATTLAVAWRTCMAPLSHQATLTYSALSEVPITDGIKCLETLPDTVGELKSAEICVSHMPSLKAKKLRKLPQEKCA